MDVYIHAHVMCILHNVYTCMYQISWYEYLSYSSNYLLISVEKTMVPNTCQWRKGKKRTGNGICWTLQCRSSWINTIRRISIWSTTPQREWRVKLSTMTSIDHLSLTLFAEIRKTNYTYIVYKYLFFQHVPFLEKSPPPPQKKN